jgi:hypothetical protein
VTWDTCRPEHSPRLRGCIGTFGSRPVRAGIAEYALIAAFRDHRFRKISKNELPTLECGFVRLFHCLRRFRLTARPGFPFLPTSRMSIHGMIGSLGRTASTYTSPLLLLAASSRDLEATFSRLRTSPTSPRSRGGRSKKQWTAPSPKPGGMGLWMMHSGTA